LEREFYARGTVAGLPRRLLFLLDWQKVAWRRFLRTSASLPAGKGATLPACSHSLAKSRLAALFADISFVAGGQRRDFARLL